jgi:hypothetical protein
MILGDKPLISEVVLSQYFTTIVITKKNYCHRKYCSACRVPVHFHFKTFTKLVHLLLIVVTQKNASGNEKSFRATHRAERGARDHNGSD